MVCEFIESKDRWNRRATAAMPALCRSLPMLPARITPVPRPSCDENLHRTKIISVTPRILNPPRVISSGIYAIPKGCDTAVTLKTPTVAKRLLTTKAAAEYLSYSAWTIRQLVHNGKLRPVSGCDDCSWRFDVNDLDEYIER